MSCAHVIEAELIALGNPAQAQKSRRFFKTGEGQYSAGDIFVGVAMPIIRAEVKSRYPLPIATTKALLRSTCHEVRIFALLMMVHSFERDDDQEKWVNAYLANLAHVNNWDLVDCSAYKILGPYLLDKDKSVLFDLVESRSLWERRISMITTLHFIKQGHVKTTLKLLDCLIEDKEDLIHKASGWMLREIGQVDQKSYRKYLNSRYKNMPRTMLRYAIEKLPIDERGAYREGLI